MKRENIKIDGSKVLLSLFEKYKNESWVLSGAEINKKRNSFFPVGKWGGLDVGRASNQLFGLQSGISLGKGLDLKSSTSFFPSKGPELSFFWDWKIIGHHDVFNISLNQLKKLIWFTGPNEIQTHSSIWYSRLNPPPIHLTSPESKFLREFIDAFSDEVSRVVALKEKKKVEKERKENIRLASLKQSQDTFLHEFDKDGNGIIDVSEGPDDLSLLLRKHQKSIINLDKNFVQKFVKISNYLMTKRQNIQILFSTIKTTKNKTELIQNIGLLKNQIHTYELLLFHSINMITSVVEEDLLVFYEIYETFDKLNIFNSHWENEVSHKLNDVKMGLNSLMSSISSMDMNITNGLKNLTYVTQEGFSDLNRSVTRELQSIDSSIKFNNLLTGISTYQLYQINKQTKGLLK